MKVVYIAHPVGGDIENNLTLIRDIVLKINLEEEDVVPFVPYYSDVVSMDDSNPEQRARGIKNNIHLLQFCDELRLYGERVSKGMWLEIAKARELGIPIRICSDNIPENILEERARKQRLRVAIVEAIISNCEITQKKTGEAQYEVSSNDLEQIILEITNAVMKDEV